MTAAAWKMLTNLGYANANAIAAVLIGLAYVCGRYRPWLRIRNTARWALSAQPKRWARTRLLLALLILADELAIAYWWRRRHPQPKRRPAPVLVVRRQGGDR